MAATVTEHDLARVLRNVLPYAEEELGSLLAQEKKFGDDCDSHEADADIAEANEILAAWDCQQPAAEPNATGRRTDEPLSRHDQHARCRD